MVRNTILYYTNSEASWKGALSSDFRQIVNAPPHLLVTVEALFQAWDRQYSKSRDYCGRQVYSVEG